MKILILGGYGVFGGRLAELLSDLPQIEFLICGRDLTRAGLSALDTEEKPGSGRSFLIVQTSPRPCVRRSLISSSTRPGHSRSMEPIAIT